MKKVIHFIHGLSMGGAETLVKEYCLGIDKTKFEVVVLCSIKNNYPYEKLLEKAEIRCIYINDYSRKKPNLIKKIFIHFIRYLKVKKIINEEKPDIIHIHLGLCRIIKFCNPSCKLFYTVHAPPEFVWRNSRKEEAAVNWLIQKKSMKLIALSQTMKNEVDLRFNVSNTYVLNNGIDFERFNKIIDTKLYRKKLGLSEDSFVIGNIGRFREEKNHSLLIDIFYEVQKKNKNAFLLLIGDGELKNQIEKKLEAYNLSGKYLILANRTDIPELLKCMDFFVLTSKVEGLGIVLIEAQKAGIKCIAPEEIVPRETKLSNLIIYEKLETTPLLWADKIINFSVNEIKYNSIDEWDIKSVILKLQDLYLYN